MAEVAKRAPIVFENRKYSETYTYVAPTTGKWTKEELETRISKYPQIKIGSKVRNTQGIGVVEEIHYDPEKVFSYQGNPTCLAVRFGNSGYSKGYISRCSYEEVTLMEE
jgi:hypothetical protein